MILAPNGKAISGGNVVTYKDLLMILLDIQNYQQTSPAFMVFNAPKIKRFYEQNRLRIDALNRNMSTLAEKHVKKTSEGRYSIVKVNGIDEYEFENDEDKLAYGKEYNEFMSKGFELHT